MSAAKVSQPRYKALAEQLINDIESGQLELGQKLPGELDMVERHQVSRFTVREALRILEDRGFVSRQRGKGTTVRSTSAFQTYRQNITGFEQLLHYPADTRRVKMGTERVEVDDLLAGAMDVPAGTVLIKHSLLRLRKNDDIPLCWQDVYMQDSMQKYGRWMSSGEGPADPAIFKDIDSRIGKVFVDVSASHVGMPMAEALNVAAGSPSLSVIRRFVDQQGKPMTVSISEYPEGRYSLSLEFTREKRAN